ncbi:MAG: hypothetical protein OEM82_08750, partial [Acidobacteriota bacterium]|nr:hypothetical protein [Acidobacteriota bacterium]
EVAAETDIDLKIATLAAGYAFVDGNEESILLRNGVSISLTPDERSGLKQPSDIRSAVARIFLDDRKIRKLELEGNVDVRQKPTTAKPGSVHARADHAVALIDGDIERLSLYDGLMIESRKASGEPVFTRADSGFYEKISETFELYDNVEIITNRDTKKASAAGAKAVYRQLKGEILLQGGASVSQNGEIVQGDAILAELDNRNALKYARATGDAILRQYRTGRTTEVSGSSMQAWFTANQLLRKADARGETRVSVVPADNSEYSRFRLAAPKGIDLAFGNKGFLTLLNTIGRTTLWLDAGSKGKSASDKTLTADTVKTTFRPAGNELATAHAVGNAELIVIPRKPSAGIYRSRVTAPRFDCDFFAGNQARSCTSDSRSELRRKRQSGKGNEQVLTANRLISHFDRETGDVGLFEAVGEAKFREGDKNGAAERIDYTPPDNLVALRGNPSVWDSKARAKAKAIDWNTESDKSVLTGSVSTTYFNQRQTGDAAPFTEKDSPVFATSDTARFDHVGRTAVYIGNARTWQGKNYVRGDKIYIEEVSGRFFAEGNVQSLIYETKRANSGSKENSSVFVSSRTMLYQRDRRQVRYERNVDIRQGTERITGTAADVFLNPENKVKYTVVSGDVVITQPNRKGTGDYVKYDAVAETVELRGDPATFTDSESGTTSGKTITVDLKNNRAVNSGSTTRTGTGRTRSVYKLKGGRLN